MEAYNAGIKREIVLYAGGLEVGTMAANVQRYAAMIGGVDIVVEAMQRGAQDVMDALAGNVSDCDTILRTTMEPETSGEA